MMKSLIAAGVIGLASACAVADVDAAKGYVKEANALIEQNSFDDAKAKLELAEAELDGVEAGAKAAVAADIAASRAKIVAASAAADKPMYTRKLNNAVDAAEGAIGNLVIWNGAARELEELLNNPACVAALPAETAAARKKFETFKKLHAKKATVALGEQLKGQVDNLEAQWKEAQETLAGDSSSSKERAVDRMAEAISDLNKSIAKLDASEEPIKSLKARVDVVSAAFTKSALGAKVQEQVATLNRQAELYRNEWDGWQSETEMLTYARLQSETSNAISYLLMPKTAALISRHTSLLKQLDERDEYKLVAGAPEVQAVVGKIKADRDAAVAKAVKSANAIVDEAEKAGVKDPSHLERVKDAVRLTLGEDSEEAKALMARMEGKIASHDAATTGAEEAKVKMINDLRAKAEVEYPKLFAGMKWEEQINLTKPGQTIGFVADNLTGYRFKPGAYYFTTTLNGEPVAAKIDPAIMKGIEATEKAIGRSLGDDDNDGKWDVIAVVTGQKVKLMAKRESEVTGTVGGEQVKATVEYAEPVDATVIEIIAAKCGPFCGVKDKGVLKPDGSVGMP